MNVKRIDVIAKRLGLSRERVLEEWTERAAIREYAGEMSRVEAERLAYEDAESALGRGSSGR